MTRQEVTDTLAPLFNGLGADGVRLNVKDATTEQVVIEMSLAEDACDTCVLPKESLEELFAQRLQEAGAAATTVRIVDR